MPTKARSSNDLMTTIARGVGSAVGRLANTAQRLAAASTEAVKAASNQGEKPRSTRPRTSGKKKAARKAVARKPAAKSKKQPRRARA